MLRRRAHSSHTVVAMLAYSTQWTRFLCVLSVRRPNGDPAHAVEKPGSFIVSLSGCVFNLGQAGCNAEIERVYSMTDGELP